MIKNFNEKIFKIRGEGYFMNKKENKKLDLKKENLDKFEIVDLKENFKELENLDDLWYLIKSSAGAWIVGSVS